MTWLAKTANDRLSVVQTLRFQIVNKRFACVSLDKKNAIATVCCPRAPLYWHTFPLTTVTFVVLLNIQWSILLLYLSGAYNIYRIRPYYALRFFKIQYWKTCGKICRYLYVPILYTLKNFQQRTYLICLCDFFFWFSLKKSVVGIHLNCIDKSMQFMLVPTTYALIKKQTKSTLPVIWRLWNCLTCAYRGLIGVCAVIRSNTVI